MQARTMTGRSMEESRLGSTPIDERWILAVGKRVDHHWIVEMTFGRRHGAPLLGRRGRAPHA